MKSVLHVAHDISVIGSNGWIVAAPVGEVVLTRVDKAFVHRKVVGDVHPMYVHIPS